MLGSADIKVRPLKLALMVDPNSALQVREAIRLACTQWGGTFFPIIPVHKRMPASWGKELLKPSSAHEVVKGYLDGFDPDILVQFGKELPDYVLDSKLKILKPDDFWSGGRENDANEPAYGIGVLDILMDIFKEHFKFKPKYPLKVIVPVIPKGLGLFWASVFGEYPSHIAQAVDKRFADALDLSHPEVRVDRFHELTEPDVLFPRRVTQWATRLQGGVGFRRNAAVFFMDASKIEDVIDFWNLRASGRQVLPLPKQFLEEKSFRQLVVEFLDEHRRPWGNDSHSFDTASLIQSRHSTMEEMQAFANSLVLPSTDGKPEASRQSMSLQHWYPRIWDEWARGKDGGVADVYGEDQETINLAGEEHLAIRLKSLIPSFGRENWFWSHGRCVNEFDLRLYGADEQLAEVFPKVEGNYLLRAITGNVGHYGEWRVGRHGLVRIVRGVRGESRKAPESEEIFFAWLNDRGWKAKLSSPGILAKQIYKRLGGMVSMLADKEILALIEHMNGGMVSRDGTQKDDRVIAEREASVAEVKRKLNANRYEWFIQKGVFKLGLQTKCPNCQRNSWFAMTALNEHLDCPKCLNTFPAAGNIDQGKGGWFYRTAGPFSVPNFADGAFSVLLTLEALAGRMISSRRSTSIPSFEATAPGKVELEADLAMFWRDGIYGDEITGILFGECKSYGLFKPKDFQRMRYLGETFPGAILVFSTLRESLTKEETVSLTRLAKIGRKYWKAERPLNPVLILTGAELLSWERPPLCWSEELQKRFQNVHSIIEHCNASQQIYLGLPSWQEDWHAAFERRRRAREKKS
ncbi:MAG: hypothetical protein EON54_09190 [Alcaligenaceae bacterium]|nr:MAG: hypothetical protein EON54_09190 [Alcaligenaceae bacterium]